MINAYYFNEELTYIELMKKMTQTVNNTKVKNIMKETNKKEKFKR